MNAHGRTFSSRGVPEDGNRVRSITKIDGPEILRLARHLVVFTPPGHQIAPLMERARKAIPMLTTAEAVERVASYNPDCFFAVTRRSKFDIKAPQGEGYFAFLPLNEAGLAALLDGSLDRRNPPISCLASQTEKIAGVYIWHVFAPGRLAVGIALACQKIWSLQNQSVDLYGWATNKSAVQFFTGIGFQTLPVAAGSTAPEFHVFRRAPHMQPARAEPSVDRPPSPQLSVRVARTVDDFMRAVAIRGAVYIGEQECPYEEEFDGNDFSATHLVGYVDGEPAGCMRIRYFADFAKVERLVVRKEFRSSGLARQIVCDSVKFCEMKGYQRVNVYAQKRLVKFWSKCGFALPEGARELVFSDFDYVEMIHNSPRQPDAISEATPPYVIIRPEGEWNTAGVLERSISRGTRRPSTNETAA